MLFKRKESGSIAMPHDASTMGRDPSQELGNRLATSLTRIESIACYIRAPYVVPVAGGMAGAVSGIVSCPLDVIKTKLQAQGGFKGQKQAMSLGAAAYRGVVGTAGTIWREEGLRGLYRGLGPMLLGYVPTWAVYLTVYNRAQGYFNTKTESKFVANVYSSLTAGACSTMVTNPIWVIKTRLMSQSSPKVNNGHYRPPWHYHNTLDAAQKMYHGEGIKSFYSGLTPALLGLTHVAIQFPLYEIFKAKFTGIGAGQTETEEDRIHHFYGLSSAIFLSKVIASTATYPHEVVRTRLQTQQRSAVNSAEMNRTAHGHIGKTVDHRRPPGVVAPEGLLGGVQTRGTIQTCKTILREEGWRGFYAGLGTNLIRAVPSAMTTILTFEYLKRAIYHNQQSAKEKHDLGAL